MLNLALIPPYGIIGAGVAWGVSIVAWNLIRLWQAWRVLHMHPFGPWVPRTAIALVFFCAAAGAVRLTLDGTPPVVQIPVGAVISTAALVAASLFTGIVSRDQLSLGAARTLVARGPRE